jgi:hypothetical protein
VHALLEERQGRQARPAHEDVGRLSDARSRAALPDRILREKIVGAVRAGFAVLFARVRARLRAGSQRARRTRRRPERALGAFA